MFAIVPLSTVVFAILATIPIFDAWTEALVDFVFQNFVPEAASTVAGTLRELAGSARQISWKGLIALMFSLLLVMLAVEQTFDRIWRVAQPRPTLWRLVVYWTLLTLGAVFAAASLAISTWLFALPAFALANVTIEQQALRLMPFVVAFVVFAAAYRLIPNRPVPLRFALAGAFLAAVLFEAAKYGFAWYLRNTNFEQLYGALAVIPIFLIWVWLSWLVVLLGASLTASLGAFRFQPRHQRLPAGAEFYACLRLLGRLAALDIVQRGERGAWLPVRDLSTVTLEDLHEGLGLRLPPADCALPGATDAIGRSALSALRHLRQPLDIALRHPLSDFLLPESDSR